MTTEAVLQFADALVDSGGEFEVHCDESRSVVAEPGLETSGTTPDEELMGHVGEGSKDALSALFYRHGRAVLNVARRILRDEAEAADLRQDVFLYLFQRAHLYDATKSSASSWIMQITYHRAIDRRRYLSSRQHYNVEQVEEGRFEPSIAQPSTDGLDGKVILDRLRGQLTTDQQQTLELHFFEGYSLREIAEKSGQSIGNVRHHYYRALERLRSNLSSKKQR